MTLSFSVRTTPHFDRLARSLNRHHSEFADRYAEALSILGKDPYNRSRSSPIRKLAGVSQGEGEYRLRLGRFRFRYDIDGHQVVLHYRGLRREDTYRR
jgi:mRNA-degrading endonuclease RelE of RelBE toxin-antitoxin system